MPREVKREFLAQEVEHGLTPYIKQEKESLEWERGTKRGREGQERTEWTTKDREYLSGQGEVVVSANRKVSVQDDWRAEMGESGYLFRTDPRMDTGGRRGETNIPLMDSELIKKKNEKGEYATERRSIVGGGNEEDKMRTSSISSYRVNHLNKEELQQCVRDLIETKVRGGWK